MKEKITELEGLRGILAWWVIASHWLVLSGIAGLDLPKPFRILLRGDMPVDVFVILSGFVIFMLLDKGRDNYPTFITRRFFRLFPTYLCSLAAMIPISFYAVRALLSLPWANDPVVTWIVTDWQYTQAHLWQHVLVHLTMLHGLLPKELLPDSPSAILGPAWSISLEWQFYLVAPFLLLAARRSLRWFVAIGAVIVVCALTAPSFGNMFEKGKFITYSLPGFLPLKAIYFFCGACSFYFYKHAPERFTPETLSRLLVALLVAVAALIQSIPLVLWCLVLGAHLLRVGGSRSLIVRSVTGSLNAPPIQWLGRISYSSYLCHVPALYSALLALVFFKTDWTRWHFLTLLVIASTPLVLLFSQLLYSFVEKPFILAAKNWTATWSKDRVLPAPGIALDRNAT
jgi:peptidoglycan/LPS O-acetylase OafA/YrhL